MSVRTRLAVLLLILTAFPVSSSAGRPVEEGNIPDMLGESHISLGTIHSFRGIGFCTQIGSGDFHSVAVVAYLTDIINGKASTPGVRITYHYDMTIHDGTTRQGYPYRIYAGPGIAQGYVRSLDSRKGYMAGLSGAAGVLAELGRNVSLSAEFQADAALIFKNRYTQYMSLYKAGFKHSYIPYIRIQYRF